MTDNYQNRNITLSNTFLKAAHDRNITIFQKYLEKGHTRMDVDSVHSVIECKLKDKPIYVPANYIDIFEGARTDKPYRVKYLTHDFCKHFRSEILQFYPT